MNLFVAGADPLGVLRTTQPIVSGSRHVRLSEGSIAAVAASIPDLNQPVPGWGGDLHYLDGTWRTAGWVLVLDALNFCFWSEDPTRRWRVEFDGTSYDGYWALVAALRRAVDEGYPLWDADFLRTLDGPTVAELLRPDGKDSLPIPLLEDRQRNLAELGSGLRALHHERGGMSDASPVETLLTAAGGSAVRLVELIVSWFPSFRDVTQFEGRDVRFLKRAQILAADLNAALVACGQPGFSDLDTLTAFADYKVPQVLRRLGVIDYDDDLTAQIDARALIPAGSRQEVEIRAATIWGVELIRRQLNELGTPMAAYEIDWALWQAGQSVSGKDRPYHRTLTMYY